MSQTTPPSEHKFTKTIITTPHSYKPAGPYSHAVLIDKTLYASGVLGLDLNTQLVHGGIEAQTRQALENLKHVLEAGGSSLDAVVKTTILLINLDDLPVLNKVYEQYFPKNYPARVMYQVAKLPLSAVVEIDAIALVAKAGP